MNDLSYINSVLINLNQMLQDISFLSPTDPIIIFLQNSISSLSSLKKELSRNK